MTAAVTANLALAAVLLAAGARLIAWGLNSDMIRGHWFRADHTDAPCLYSGCGRPHADHVESVGEWTDTRHWFRPTLHRPARCARCGLLFAHSTHHGSRKNRRLWHSQ